MKRHPGNSELLPLDGNAANADIDSDVGGVLPLPIGLKSEDGHDDKRAEEEIEKIPVHRPIFCCFAVDAGGFRRPILMGDRRRIVNTYENSTVNCAPSFFPPRPKCNSPFIRETRDRIIFMPSPLQAAGSKPSGRAGPSLETDSA
jgi:hypothetical protein